MAAAQREVWTGTQLQRLLAERAGLQMSSASVSALFSKEPSQVKMSTLIALCTALDCTPNDLFEVDTTPVERPAAPIRPVADLSKAVSAQGRSMPPLCPGEEGIVGVKQRDGTGCGAPVGFIDRRYCCRCTARQKEAAARAACPRCGQQRVLQEDTGRCITCSRVCTACGHPVRSKSSALCRTCLRKSERDAAKDPCPRCSRPGYLREDTGWCGHCSRPRQAKQPPPPPPARGKMVFLGGGGFFFF
ncbi:helix-turn-helix transcriptional regulator, partial [Streptomyces sp. NPDC048270]|uniref:helix-turn-helix domain-containing protein n=1 Tax=Streptomyces sp. NPDC048270 TaxID=3154615 RepID=UPI003407CBFB